MTRRRWWVVGGLAGLVIAVAAALLIWQSTTRPPTAEETAQSYLRALESGDPAAIEATGIDVTDDALSVFAGAERWIEDAEVVAVTESDDGRAAAEVSFRLAGEEQTAQIPLSLADGRWRPEAAALGTMSATTTVGDFIAIGDARLPAGEATPLLPAVYSVTTAPTKLLDGESTLVVLPGETTDIELEAELRAEATNAAQEQLDEHLKTCTAPGSSPPAGCGIRIPWGTEFRAVSEIRYRIEQFPRVTLTPTAFSAIDGVLVATVTGTGQDGAPRTTTYRTDSWTVRGDVSFTTDDLVLTAW